MPPKQLPPKQKKNYTYDFDNGITANKQINCKQQYIKTGLPGKRILYIPLNLTL